MFLSYTSFERPLEELSTGKESVFSIVGKGNVKFQMYINGKTRNIILEDVLHTPGLRSNLISVSKLERKGTGVMLQISFLRKVTFDKLYNNEFLIKVCSRTLSIFSEHNTI